MLVPRATNVTSFYPSISNDSKLVVFNQSTCGTDPDVNRTADRLRQPVAATATTTAARRSGSSRPGGGNPVRLDAANGAGEQRQLVAALQPRQGQLPRRADLLGRVLVAAARTGGRSTQPPPSHQAAALDRGRAHRREHRRRSQLGGGLAADAESEADRRPGQSRSALGEVRRRHRGLTLSSTARGALLAAGLLFAVGCSVDERRSVRQPARRAMAGAGGVDALRAAAGGALATVGTGGTGAGIVGDGGRRGRCGRRAARPAGVSAAGARRHRRRRRGRDGGRERRCRLDGDGGRRARRRGAARAGWRRYRWHHLRHAGRDQGVRGLHGRRRQLHGRHLPVQLRHAVQSLHGGHQVPEGDRLLDRMSGVRLRGRHRLPQRHQLHGALRPERVYGRGSVRRQPVLGHVPGRQLVQGRRHGRRQHEHDHLFGHRLVPGRGHLLGRVLSGELHGPAIMRDGRRGGRRRRTTSLAAATARAPDGFAAAATPARPTAPAQRMRDGGVLFRRELHADAAEPAMPLAGPLSAPTTTRLLRHGRRPIAWRVPRDHRSIKFRTRDRGRRPISRSLATSAARRT